MGILKGSPAAGLDDGNQLPQATEYLPHGVLRRGIGRNAFSRLAETTDRDFSGKGREGGRQQAYD